MNNSEATAESAEPAAAGIRSAPSRAELAELALRQKNNFLQALIDSMPDMIFCKDKEFRVTLVNKAFCEASGQCAEEIIGRTAHELYPREIADVFQAMDEKLFAKGETVVNEEWFESSNGQRIRLATTKIPYRGHNGDVVGMMAISHDITERDARDLERGVLVKQLQSAMRQLSEERKKLRELNEQLTRISQRDGLTGVYNRRALDERMTAEWNRCRREETELTLILMDVDHFKAFNDSYGHLAGDDCLKKISKVLDETASRASDFVARYGGEEFAILVPGVNAEEAMVLAENCRQQVESLAIAHEQSSTNDVVSISGGVATLVPDGETGIDDLIKLADERLYLAKRTRNSVRD